MGNLEDLLQPETGRAKAEEVGLLLNAVGERSHLSQIIITSREKPKDLANRYDPSGAFDPLLIHLARLDGIDDAAAIETLRQYGLSDSEADLRWVAERVQGQVLVLRLLAATAKGKPGYLRKHPALVTQKAEPLLQEQLRRQNEGAIDLLRRMAVLRVGIDGAGLTFLRLYPQDGAALDGRFDRAIEIREPVEFTSAELSATQGILQPLVDSSLVQERYDKQRCELFYDLHRVVVEFLQQQFAAELPNLINSVYAFYKSSCTLENPRTLGSL
ncbi:MAG: hypothetical protein MUF49_23060 [Oculatellaceae cyanobacterium Prado106]|nr:hypothetical protein [Oculatellaceae cyanobacterium Prado106]